MEDILTYVIIFGFGIGLVSLYLYRKDKQRLLPVSVQHYSNLVMSVLIEKEKSELTEIVIRLDSKEKALYPSSLALELIDAKRNKQIAELTHLIQGNKSNNLPVSEFHITADDFLALLKEVDFPFVSFRIVVKTSGGNQFKSHELAYDQRWKLYKLDSGNYN